MPTLQLTDSGEWTVPEGVTSVDVTMLGTGKDGHDFDEADESNPANGGDGGDGAPFIKIEGLPVSSGDVFAYDVAGNLDLNDGNIVLQDLTEFQTTDIDDYIAAQTSGGQGQSITEGELGGAGGGAAAETTNGQEGGAHQPARAGEGGKGADVDGVAKVGGVGFVIFTWKNPGAPDDREWPRAEYPEADTPLQTWADEAGLGVP